MRETNIEYDREKNDFLMNGKYFLDHLEKHETVISNQHLVSVLSQKGACDRLLGLSKPDLQDGAVAIYLCSHCGGYDGSPIGIKLVFEDDHVIWKDIGFYQDYEGDSPLLFSKVKSYVFPMAQYKGLFERLRIYEP